MAYYKSNVYAKKTIRTDREKGQRTVYDKNRKKILMSQEVCGICGHPVDKNLKFPHPFSATVDHIIPVSKGGHPTDIENLQLAHNRCNRLKSDNLTVLEPTKPKTIEKKEEGRPYNRDLPLFIDWRLYNTKNAKELRQSILALEKQGKSMYFDGF